MPGFVMTPLSDEHRREIGEVVAQFAMTEFLVGQLIGRFVGIEQRTQQIMTAHLGARALFDIWAALGVEVMKKPGNLAVHKSLVERAEKVRVRRDAVIHGIWSAVPTKETVSKARMTARGLKGYEFKSSPMAVGDLKALVSELSGLNGALMEVLIKVSQSPETPESPTPIAPT